MRKAGKRIGAIMLGVCMLAIPSSAQEISDKAVKSFMEYAWSMTPAKFTKPDGKTIEIDKKNRTTVEVPQDVARDIIKAARLSAHAQTCNLPEEQVLNYRSLMKREENKKKWSEPQMIYINQLHLVTVMLLNGKLQLVETQDGKEPKIIEEPKQKVATCTDEQAKKVKELITAYVKSGPPVTLPSGPLLGKVIEDAAKRAGQAAPAAPGAPAAAPPAAAPTAAPPAKKP
jgi:hypothetical protein